MDSGRNGAPPAHRSEAPSCTERGGAAAGGQRRHRAEQDDRRLKAHRHRPRPARRSGEDGDGEEAEAHAALRESARACRMRRLPRRRRLQGRHHNKQMAAAMWSHFVRDLRTKGGRRRSSATPATRAKQSLGQERQEGALGLHAARTTKTSSSGPTKKSHSCETCHSDPFERKVFAKVWKIVPLGAEAAPVAELRGGAEGRAEYARTSARPTR